MLALDDGFEPVVHMQFVQQVLNVVAHRGLADTHRGSDFPGGFSFRQQFQDIMLPARQGSPLAIPREPAGSMMVFGDVAGFLRRMAYMQEQAMSGFIKNLQAAYREFFPSLGSCS